jgi:hypothetical protein
MQNNLTERKVDLAIRFYSLLCNCSVLRLTDIPEASLCVIMVLNENELLSAVVKKSLMNGIQESKLVRRYKVSRKYVINRKKELKF